MRVDREDAGREERERDEEDAEREDGERGLVEREEPERDDDVREDDDDRDDEAEREDEAERDEDAEREDEDRAVVERAVVECDRVPRRVDSLELTVHPPLSSSVGRIYPAVIHLLQQHLHQLCPRWLQPRLQCQQEYSRL